jgi:hypothetical protein
MIARVHATEKTSFLIFTCAGCGSGHLIPFFHAAPDPGAIWTWNNNLEAPTITPSIKTTAPGPRICHFILGDGVQHFCSDDTQVPGQHLPLPALEH